MPDGVRLAGLTDGPEPPRRPTGVFWLSGFKSEMTGTKAQYLAAEAARAGRQCVRFDYSGHGASGGAFRDGTVSRWLEETVTVFEGHTKGPQVVVGSSMGGWLALLLARHLGATGAARLAGLVLIAPAADMTEDLMWNAYGEEARRQILEEGAFEQPSQYSDEPYLITRALIEDGRRHLILQSGLTVACPVRILQGDADPDVPPAHAGRVFEALRGDDITFTLVKGGDHRLSAPSHLALLGETVAALWARAEATHPGSMADSSAARPSR
jgi:pimeloyl-ACP methyl ester carboxylesterase